MWFVWLALAIDAPAAPLLSAEMAMTTLGMIILQASPILLVLFTCLVCNMLDNATPGRWWDA